MKHLKLILFSISVFAIVIYGFTRISGDGPEVQVTMEANGIKMLPSTIPVPFNLQTGVLNILSRESESRGVYVYAITNISKKDGYSEISVAGLPPEIQVMRLQDAIWIGLVTIGPGPEYLGSVTDLTAESSQTFDRGGSQNILPFRSGTTAIYGMLGVHNCGFSLNGWSAVDLFPSENMVYAANDGSTSYVCRDDHQVSLRIGGFLYAHILDTGQATGDDYSQGQQIGGMALGTFDDTCGYADQQPDHYHVHFCFQQNGAGTFSADGYALNIYNGNWVRGEETVSPTGTLTATWTNAEGDPISGPTARFNLWDEITKGVINLVKSSISGLPDHQDMQIPEKIMGKATPIIQLLSPTVFSMFAMTIPIFVVFTIMLLEGVRFVMAVYMLIKRLIPVIG